MARSVSMRTITIHSLTRLNNSTNGNPRFAITWARDIDGALVTRHTSSDAAIGYEIGNPGLRAGDVVDIDMTKAERITDMRPVPAQRERFA